MIAIPPGVRVLVAMRPVDFRKGAHGLAALAAEVLGEDPFSSAVLVFRAKRTDRIKLLIWDGSGLVLVVMRLSAVEFAALFDGLDWSRVQTTRRIPKPIAVA
ncbi:MAG: hypothetical protein B7X09_01240 [Acidiphilium sp. 21-66-27]|nr:MAG: hypothetical protein B7X09_01240 [Acidiphilium sp. 21-66-27]